MGPSMDPGFNPVSVTLSMWASGLSVEKDWTRSLHLCPCDQSITLHLVHLTLALTGMGLTLGGRRDHILK